MPRAASGWEKGPEFAKTIPNFMIYPSVTFIVKTLVSGHHETEAKSSDGEQGSCYGGQKCFETPSLDPYLLGDCDCRRKRSKAPAKAGGEIDVDGVGAGMGEKSVADEIHSGPESESDEETSQDVDDGSHQVSVTGEKVFPQFFKKKTRGRSNPAPAAQNY